jgi:hypothetical protein
MDNGGAETQRVPRVIECSTFRLELFLRLSNSSGIHELPTSIVDSNDGEENAEYGNYDIEGIHLNLS